MKPGDSVTCNCWHETDDKLRRNGYKISDACTGFDIDVRALRFQTCFGLPLARVDGKRRKRGEPSVIIISHCPFCGAPLEKISSAPAEAEMPKQPDAGASGKAEQAERSQP